MVNGTKGKLEVITGCMFSGKTIELQRRLERVEIAKRKYALFKPFIDTRGTPDRVKAHVFGGNLGREMPATRLPDDVDTYADLARMYEAGDLDSCEVVGFDEGNFFASGIVNLCTELVDHGKRVVVAGLDLNFRAKPFGAMPLLLALADHVTKLSAVCMQCGKDATRSQRLIDGVPAPASSPEILVGGLDSYQARCKDCFVLT